MMGELCCHENGEKYTEKACLKLTIKSGSADRASHSGCHHSEVATSSTGFAGVKAGMSSLPGGR